MLGVLCSPDLHQRRQDRKGLIYNMQADGYSLDDKRDFIGGKGDILEIIERYTKRREENQIWVH